MFRETLIFLCRGSDMGQTIFIGALVVVVQIRRRRRRVLPVSLSRVELTVTDSQRTKS